MMRSGATRSARAMAADLPERAAAALARSGLVLRGGLNFEPGEPRPPGPGGAPAAAVLLVGNVGAGYWPVFTRWLDRQATPPADPLDQWSRAVIARAAAQVGARVAMPSDRPFAPFQQWAMRAGGLKPSPLGLLMHPRYGLWHAYRGALLFDAPLPGTVRPGPDGPGGHPCDSCAAKPCLHACPVAAHTAADFAAAACIAHARGPRGGACARQCLARDACPHGRAWRYPAEVLAFHQRAFTGA